MREADVISAHAHAHSMHACTHTLLRGTFFGQDFVKTNCIVIIGFPV
jgi:hypothetical protein